MFVIFRDWRRLVAVEIKNRVLRKKESISADAWVQIYDICRKTVQDLNFILIELEQFRTCMLPADQNKRKSSLEICLNAHRIIHNVSKQMCISSGNASITLKVYVLDSLLILISLILRRFDKIYVYFFFLSVPLFICFKIRQPSNTYSCSL